MKKTMYFILPILLITAMHLNGAAARRCAQMARKACYGATLGVSGWLAYKIMDEQKQIERMQAQRETAKAFHRKCIAHFKENYPENDLWASQKIEGDLSWIAGIERGEAQEKTARSETLKMQRAKQDERAMGVYSPFGRILK